MYPGNEPQSQGGNQGDSQSSNGGSNQQNPQNQPNPGMKIDITPQSPIQTQQPIYQQQTQGPKRLQKVKLPFDKGMKRFLIPIILIIAIAAVLSAVMLIRPPPKVTTTTIASTTTVPITNLGAINSCGTISKPGSYYLESSISSSGAKSCISINASDVSFICNQNKIKGSGPYTTKPPFSYGIEIDGQHNVSIQDCGISNFSYGVYSEGSTSISVKNNNLTNDYISNIRFSGSSYGTISNNYISQSFAYGGAISITNESHNDTISNNTLDTLAQYGMLIDSIGNKFINNSIYSTPTSFYCKATSGFKNNNYAYANLCTNNTGCNFLECHGINVQTNMSQIVLGSSVDSCGTINAPGTYALASSLNMSEYVNVNRTTSPCINIASSDVTLNCNNHTITDSPTAIYSASNTGINIENCRVTNSGTGIYLGSVSNSNITNTRIYNATDYGIRLNNSNGIYVNNLTDRFGDYGLYLSGSEGITVSGFSIFNNTFGTYLNSSLGNAFSHGYVFNNTHVDIFATPNSANVTDNLLQTTECGVTDAAWASSCTETISPTLLYYPINSCSNLNHAGTYMLTANLTNLGNRCFAILQNNTVLNCNYHSIQSTHTGGAAISLYGKSNVTVENCTIKGFGTGIQAVKSKAVSLLQNNMSGALTGINLTNVTKASLRYNRMSQNANYGVYLNGTKNSSIINNSVTYGLGKAIGLYISNSTTDSIYNNTASSITTGFYFAGSSIGNNVSYNSATASSTDYVCNAYNSPINAENGGINYGQTKIGCRWLAALSLTNPQAPCALSISPSMYGLKSDYEYTYGGTCFTIESNSTTIDCNGHTIIATNGGSFANFVGSSGSILEDCYLKGFTSPVTADKSGINLLNNTILINSSAELNTYAVNISNSKNAKISYNNITAPYYGIYLYNDSYGKLQGNNVTAYIGAYTLNDTDGMAISGNAAPYYGTYGMSLYNSTADTLSNSNLSGVFGLTCSSGSTSSVADIDLGGNRCTANVNCA
ncbi:MAG: NosD domain-containing protein, partial [Candidatus Micrarchaeaceae archaeon]